MTHPFSEDYNPRESDEDLVVGVQAGDYQALERLVLRHQAWIYNVAMKMVANNADAQDVTQEVLVKFITKLSTFRGRSSFRTWLYRIVTNHVINMKQSIVESQVTTFAEYGQGLDSAPELDIPDRRGWPEEEVLIAESRVGCMSAMLLCLDREQRIVFILGEVFGISDRVGGEVLDISRGAFRQKLSRAREQLYAFMDQKCGLIKKSNPCRCAKKTAAFIERGYVNPERLEFHAEYVGRIRDRVERESESRARTFEESYQVLYRDHPFQEPPDYSQRIVALIEDEGFRETFRV